MTTTLAPWQSSLATDADRCALGFHASQHPQYCDCAEGSEWATFVAALKQARRPDGTISQTDVRPLIKGRVEPRHVGPMWQRAVREYLVKRDGREDSTDIGGRNGDKLQWRYRWIGAAA